MGANMSLEKQNELFPNNLEHKIKQKLEKHRQKFGIVVQEEKDLDSKLRADNDALMH